MNNQVVSKYLESSYREPHTGQDVCFFLMPVRLKHAYQASWSRWNQRRCRLITWFKHGEKLDLVSHLSHSSQVRGFNSLPPSASESRFPHISAGFRKRTKSLQQSSREEKKGSEGSPSIMNAAQPRSKQNDWLGIFFSFSFGLAELLLSSEASKDLRAYTDSHRISF